ncbi:MAG TPA: hypothetical protein VEC12_11425, partial [Bacteroidia bacterium]|nr:hypothetical protein [Bacteroidia bacterium]
MKNIYPLLFILVAITAKSQNWQTVYSDRIQYFDSSRQAIKIIHKYVDSAGDSVFRNYTQYMIDSSGNSSRPYGKIKDSSSWIGRRILIKSNGYNAFVNDSNQLYWIKTQAQLHDTFTYIENSRFHIKGICDTVYYADTFGITDSVKRFKFTFAAKPGYAGNFGDTSKFEILLSKHHGLLKTPVYGGVVKKYGIFPT